MNNVLVLLRHSLRRRRAFLLAAMGVLFLFQVLMVAAARALDGSGLFSAIGGLVPEFLQQWTSIVAGSFQGLVLFGHSHPLVVLLVIGLAITTATETSEEIESKFVDVLMARPVSRSAPINRSILALLVVITGATASLVLGTWSGLLLLKPSAAVSPRPQVVLAMAGDLALIALAWGGIALAITALSTRRVTAGAISGLLVFATYVLDYVGRFWHAASTLARVSPFHYYNPMQIIGGALPRGSDAAVLASIALAGCLVAHVVYARRDL
jgi:ABC-type transport system involved in multi-copper enzyme maturation permease subunit